MSAAPPPDLAAIRSVLSRATGTGWEAAYRQDVGALLDEVERLRADLDALSRAVGQAVVASSLAAGETLADPIPHIIVSTVTRLRAEALGQRADNATVGALAYADGRDDERAAVVAFVRGARLDELADAIERGEHRREEEG